MSERKLKEALDNTTYAGIPMLIYQEIRKLTIYSETMEIKMRCCRLRNGERDSDRQSKRNTLLPKRRHRQKNRCQNQLKTQHETI